MRETYEKRAVKIRENLLQMFKEEYAKLWDNSLNNKFMAERVISTSKGLLDSVIAQELTIAGIQSEFTLNRRVQRI